jgi:hypothetical protein
VYINLHIKKGTRVEDIARQFSLYYPYLKLELYKKRFEMEQALKRKDESESNGNSPLLKEFIEDCAINISSNRTVAEVQNECACLGLNAHVLRKAGSMWIETSLTDDWTLQHQNYEGEQICKHFNKGLSCDCIIEQ